jgi:single-strand DNA-binding protein
MDQTRRQQPAGPSGSQPGGSGDEEDTFEPDDDLPF